MNLSFWAPISLQVTLEEIPAIKTFTYAWLCWAAKTPMSQTIVLWNIYRLEKGCLRVFNIPVHNFWKWLILQYIFDQRMRMICKWHKKCSKVFVIRDSFSMRSMLKQTVSWSYLWASKGPVCMEGGGTPGSWGNPLWWTKTITRVYLQSYNLAIPWCTFSRLLNGR